MSRKRLYNLPNHSIACRKPTHFELICALLLAQCSPTACLGTFSPKPIDANSWPDKFPAKTHCSKCGLCETEYVTHVVDACAFLDDGMKRNIDGLESVVHGRRRKADAHEDKHGMADEARFGVMHSPMFLARGKGISNAQWTGCVTGIAVSMLESKMVDAVVCIASQDDGADDWSTPEPILARTVEDIMRGRRVKPALAPSLRVLDELRESPEIKKLLFCGVGCAVQAFRAIQGELGIEEIFVLGTNCADNSPTPEAAKEFLRRSDFRVHVKYTGDDKAANISYERLPYFCLPGDVAQFAIADACLACFDYTNALADVVVGYMAAPIASTNFQMHQSQQTVTVRNTRGERMIQCAVDAGRLEIGGVASGTGNHEKFASATVSSDNIVQAMIGGNMKEQGMPRFLGEVMATIMTGVGPKGVNFARYSIDYHVLRNYLHVLDVWGEDATKNKLPDYAHSIVKSYLDTDETFQRLVANIKSKK
ncbi:hypothetical protein ACHAWX_005787 [Stephanocyclus meneghinianus]